MLDFFEINIFKPKKLSFSQRSLIFRSDLIFFLMIFAADKGYGYRVRALYEIKIGLVRLTVLSRDPDLGCPQLSSADECRKVKFQLLNGLARW